LNIYRRILQELYGVVVSELALVVLHPNFDHYRVVKINMMDEEVEAMFQMRRARLEALLAPPEATVPAGPIVVEEPEPEANGRALFVEED
jgi:hypothetical protein